MTPAFTDLLVISGYRSGPVPGIGDPGGARAVLFEPGPHESAL